MRPIRLPIRRFAHGGNYEKRTEIKAKYDPTNFFRLNQNIKPTNPGKYDN
jgi:hypothetical protein